jgi:four helix bundle protein
MHNFRELKIWQRAIVLAETIYKIVNTFPSEEKFGLTSQLKRCSVSVASNISEGAGRATKKQFKYFLEISMGSCNEIQTQIEISIRLGFLERVKAEEIIDETYQLYKMILGFYNSLGSE